MTPQAREVLIIGGGAAGLSAALTLARARRRVTVIDSGEPRNASAEGVHGLLGLENVSPLELLARGRTEVESYGGEILTGRVVVSSTVPDGFRVTLDDGRALDAGVLLIATGVTDEFPAIPGLRERWGRDVVHCPYCHGWEIRDRRIGLLATGPMSALQSLLFQQWSPHVTFFPQDLQFSDDDLRKLTAAGIPIVPGEVVRVEVDEDHLAGVRLRDGSLVELDALALPARATARTEGLEGLRLELEESFVGPTIVADASGRTTVPGVWTAGNAVNAAMQVSEAAANGARVAMTINTDLVFQDAGQRMRDPRTPTSKKGKHP